MRHFILKLVLAKNLYGYWDKAHSFGTIPNTPDKPACPASPRPSQESGHNVCIAMAFKPWVQENTPP